MRYVYRKNLGSKQVSNEICIQKNLGRKQVNDEIMYTEKLRQQSKWQ